MSNNVTAEDVKSLAIVATQAAVTALSFSAFSGALGTLMASTSMAELPSKLKASKTGLQDLRAQFGNELVDRALKKAGPNDDILSISEAVDAAFQESLHVRFTDFEVNTALNACPPGDMRCVWEVAQALHSKGVKPTTIPEKTKIIATDAATISVKKRSKHAGHHVGTPTIDTFTGKKYDSLNKAAIAIAPEYGLVTKNPVTNKTISFPAYELERKPGYPKGRLQSVAYYEAHKNDSK